MARIQKLAMALMLALALHGALLFYGASRVSGLAAPEAAEADAKDVITGAEQGAPAATPSDTQQPIDVGWTQPTEEKQPDTVLLEEPKPLPPRPPAAATAPRAKPEPKPAAAAASKPTPKTAAAGAATMPVIAADSSYANRVRQHLARYAGALPPGANGEARVQFVVQPDGRVSDVHLVRNSGHAGLDSLALNLPTMAQPLPLPGPLPQRLEVPVQAVAAQP